MKTKKITLATIKSFCNKNFENLYIRINSSFDGMQDMITQNENAQFHKVTLIDFNKYFCFQLANGEQEAFASSSRNYFTKLDNGYHVSNCCVS